MKRPLTATTRSSLCFFAATAIVGFFSCTSEAATVYVNWGGVDSSYFHDESEQPCQYEGSIVLSHPMSIDYEDTHYVLGSLMLQAAQMTVDEINMFPRCGVSVGDRNYSIALQTYGDQSDQNKTQRIGQTIATDNQTDILLAGYSSFLTSILTPIAQEHQKLCITGGSSRTSVHANKTYVFGLNPPSGSYLEYVFQAASAKGAKTVAYLQEESTDPCAGVERLAQQYNMQVVSATNIPELASLESYIWVAKEMAALDPDLMITCVRTRYGEWNQAMRHVNWTPKAQAYTYVGGTDEFEREIGPVDLPYIMAVGGWDSALPPVPDAATGWTPKDFDRVFEQAAFRRPQYQQVQQSAVISILAQAIEQVGAFKSQNATDQIRDVLANGYFPTVYGNVSFDENGQNAAPFLLLQYDENATMHILLPETHHHTSIEMVYPLPTWINRDCVGLSPCIGQGGVCTGNGSCACPPHLVTKPDLVGSHAACDEPTNSSSSVTAAQVGSHVYVLSALIPILLACLVGGLVYRHFQLKNDSVWQVKKRELKFDDPPRIIGRGTFGVVLLAEYRGTSVAIKRVLPSKQKSSGLMKVASKDTVGDQNKSWDVESGDGMKKSTYSGSGSSRSSGLLSGFRTKRSNTSIGKLKADFYKEMRTISRLRHPCITTIMGAVVGLSEEPTLVMEYLNHGSLKDLLANETMFIDGEMLLSILRDISQGCRFLHGAKPPIIHGDLKAQNVLVDQKFRAKVCDFGLSKRTRSGVTGTPFFMAPELLNRSSLNNAATDVYGFGMIVYETYSRKDPYEDDDEDFHEILRQIVDPIINKRPPVPYDCPPQVASLMFDCMVANPEERPTFEELDKRLHRIEVSALKSLDETRHSIDAKNSGRTSVSLFDLFPQHVAEALRDGMPVQPEHKDSVTIFFSDIVGFTKISSELEPRKIANMLDRLYTKFDGLSQEHDIFKVETIGDAYMAVTNLVKDQPGDHASRIANFAVDAIEAANETLINEDDPFMGHVDIRVGFHTGPVVADVVGSKNPRYCLFGDTVNTASRMESNSKKNRIHCSQAALDQLRIESYPLPIASRGFINVKGKGNMATYWVNEAGLPAAAIPLSTVPEDDLTESERFISSLSNHNHHLVPPMPPRQVKPQRRASTR